MVAFGAKILRTLNINIQCLWSEWYVPVTGYNPGNCEVDECVAVLSVYVPNLFYKTK